MQFSNFFRFINQVIAPVRKGLPTMQHADGGAETKQPLSVLLVDDDDFSMLIAKSVVKKAGVALEILTAPDGRQALALIEDASRRGKCPDLVLLDIYMPVMGGFEFMEALQAASLNRPSMKIVILSSSLHDLEVAKARKLPVIGCIEKPLSAEKLFKYL